MLDCIKMLKKVEVIWKISFHEFSIKKYFAKSCNAILMSLKTSAERVQIGSNEFATPQILQCWSLKSTPLKCIKLSVYKKASI